MKVRCLIIDDEPLAREGLEQYAADVPFLELVGTAGNALQALPMVQKLEPDLLFLDIEMPKLSGLDFIRTLARPPLIILTTAYPAYALEGFELEVLDYLLKPITFDRFLKAAMRAQRRLAERKTDGKTDEEQAEPVAATVETEVEADHFFVKADGRIERITLADFYYAEAMQNYIQLYTRRGRFTTLLSLRELEASVPHPDLMRVHKSFFAHLGQVSTVDGRQLLIADRKIPVSRAKWAAVEARLLGGQLLG
ncbi:MAG: LytTR family DNA-binding domain-containing protein [Bacteroidota bacterium]